MYKMWRAVIIIGLILLLFLVADNPNGEIANTVRETGSIVKEKSGDLKDNLADKDYSFDTDPNGGETT